MVAARGYFSRRRFSFGGNWSVFLVAVTVAVAVAVAVVVVVMMMVRIVGL